LSLRKIKEKFNFVKIKISNGLIDNKLKKLYRIYVLTQNIMKEMIKNVINCKKKTVDYMGIFKDLTVAH